MDTSIRDLTHEELQHLLGAYALGATTDDESRLLGAHLKTCDECQAEFNQLLIAVAAIPVGTEPVEPPTALRGSILAALESEQRKPVNQPQLTALKTVQSPQSPATEPVSIESQRNRWLPWAVAAALLIASLGLLVWNNELRNDENEPQTIALVATDPGSTSGGEVEVLEDNVLLMTTHNLPEIGDDQVYQIWLIAGDDVQSAGVMQAGDDSFAVSADPADYDLLAVTVEPGPLGVPVATTAPILVADLDTA